LKRCTKCILPENFPNIKFNNEGICNYCLTHVPIKYKGEAVFRILLDDYRSKGEKYDCIVPVSGGKDSLFVLYQVMNKYKLRVLASHYDSGFVSEQAMKNIGNAIKMLQVDFILEHVSKPLFRPSEF
jgi:tRNA(Ile)-lysidine synthase TilS/MesJ